MRWFGVQVDWALHPSRVDVPKAALGAAVCLLATCARAENGGRIAGAKAMSARALVLLANVTATDLAAVVSAGLATWDGEDLVMGGYDHQGEAVLRGRSKGGKTRAASATRRPDGSYASSPGSIPGSIPASSPGSIPGSIPASIPGSIPASSASSRSDPIRSTSGRAREPRTGGDLARAALLRAGVWPGPEADQELERAGVRVEYDDPGHTQEPEEGGDE